MSADPGAQEIVIDEDVDNVLHSGTLRERLQDPSLGEGTITLIIRDPNITIIGDMNIYWGDREKAPLYGCKSLLRVDLKGCTQLTQLGNYVFDGCTSLTSVTLPDGLTQLGNNVFVNCSSLTSVALPDGLTKLGGSVFYGCSSLKSVMLPVLITQVSNNVFWDCPSLGTVAHSAGYSNIILYLRDRYKCVTLRKLFLRLLRKYNQVVNEAIGTEAEKHAIALAYFPTDNSSTLDVGLFLQTMSTSGGNGIQGLVGYILKFV